ncbi:MAG: hypothetical protein KDB23_10610 [Planctomycetales bacterium]|nr:hypothetical protein [Planctomycetales bacterium]
MRVGGHRAEDDVSARRRIGFRGYEPLEYRRVLSDDHGDTFAAATLIAPWVNIEAQFETVNDVDWFRIDAVAGENYSLQVPFDNMDIQWFDHDGMTRLESGVFFDVSNHTTYAEFWAVESGPLYLQFAPPQAEYTGNYHFTLSTYPDDYGSTRQTATQVELTNNTLSLAGTLETPADRDWLRFDVIAGESYDFSAEGNSVYFTVTGSDGRFITSDDFAWQADQNETLYISVEATAVSFVPYYQIAVNQYHDDYTNDRREAELLSSPTDVRGALETEHDIDTFKVSVQPDHQYRYELETVAPIGDVVVNFFDADGVSIPVRIEEIPPTGGTYRRIFEWDSLANTEVVVEILMQAGISSSPLGTYRLLGVTQYDDSTPSTPRAIAANETVFGRFEHTDDEDWFTFAPQAGEFYQWVTNRRSSLVVERINALDQVSTWLTFETWQAESSQPIRLRVDAVGLGDPEYDLTLLPIAVGPIDPRPTAIPLAPDRTDTRIMWQYWGATWFELPASETTLQVTWSDNAQSIYWSLFDANLSGSDNGVVSQSLYLWPSDFPRYLKVYDVSQQPITTSLAVIDEERDDDTPATATRLAFGERVNGFLETTSDTDWYVFDAVAGRDYLVESGEIELVGSSTFHCFDRPCHWQSDVTGPVYVQVYSGPAYSIQIDEYRDPGSNLESPVPLTDNHSYRGQIDYQYDADFYEAVISPGVTYEISVSTIASTVRLVDFSGDPLLRWNVIGPDRLILEGVQTPTLARFVVNSSQPSPFDYDITIVAHHDDYGAEIEVAAPIAIGQQRSGSLFGSDGDMFVVPTQASHRYRVVIETEAASIGVSVFVNGLWTRLRDTKLLDFTSNGGPAYVLLTNRVPSTDYRIVVYDVPAYGMNAASAIHLSLPAKQLIHATGQSEMFRFDAVAGSIYQLRIDSASNSAISATFTLGDAGPELARTTNTSELFWRSTVTGPVYLQLGATAGEYAIDLQQVVYNEADTTASAAAVDVNATFSRSFRGMNDIDWIRVIPHEKSTLELLWLPPYATDENGAALNVSAYYDDGTLAGQLELDEAYYGVGRQYLWWSDSSRPLLLSIQLADSPLGDVSQSHTFAFRSVPQEHPTTIVAAQRVFAPATVLGPARFFLDRTEHADHYVFSAEAGKQYRVTVIGGGSTSLINRSGLQLPNVTSRDGRWTWTVSQSRTEDLIIRIGGDFWGQYTLDVMEIQPDELDSISQPLSDIVFGQRLTGDLQHELDVDYFAFEAVAGTTYYVLAKHELGDGVRVDILDAATRDRQATGIVGFSDTAPLHWTAPASGSYRLAISGMLLNSGTYWFVVNAGDDLVDELGDVTASSAAARALVLEDEYDVDWIRAEVTTGLAYNLRVEFNGFRVPAVNLYDIDGKPIPTFGTEDLSLKTYTWLSSYTGTVNISINENLAAGMGSYDLSWEVAAGDANLDGRFDSSDFVQVFQFGTYERDDLQQVTWAEGDWNGDGRFTSSDLVAAFVRGAYQE